MELVVLEEFEDKFNACLDYALANFGRKTVRKWKESFQRILKNLQVNPEMYPFVPELRDCQPNAHSAIIMKNFVIDSQDGNEKRQSPCWFRRSSARIENVS